MCEVGLGCGRARVNGGSKGARRVLHAGVADLDRPGLRAGPRGAKGPL